MDFPHGGHLRQLAERAGRAPEDILDFSANVNPLGPPACLRPVLSREAEALVHYPDPDCAALVAAIREHFPKPKAEILAANGSTEILYACPRALKARRAVVTAPAYLDYAEAARLCGLEVATHSLSEASGFAVDWEALSRALRPGDMVFLGRPNNPTGAVFGLDEFSACAQARPESLFVVDESFGDFVEGFASVASAGLPNVIMVRSLTKFYAIPGLRLGFAVVPEGLAPTLRRHILPWTVNRLAQAVGAEALADRSYAEATRKKVRAWREDLIQGLKELSGLTVTPGEANFLLLRLAAPGGDARALADRLLREDGIAVRVCDNYAGLDRRYLRVAVRRPEENARLLSALATVLAPKARPRLPRRPTPALMFQGTGSNAGKSVLTAALCRILLEDGLRVAPFKAQNMSLNSFVTRDGGEMGRAQVLQAQACRLDPDVRMNPVLLKPSSDTGSQVIVMGRPVGHMGVGDYIRYKPAAWEIVREAYDGLSREVDAVILEGAGSPGEVNLKAHDIVNMRMAAHARAPVLLVGDIDRGGVFAAFVGTMEVLEAWERRLVAGFVVNRFRGEAALLEDALAYTGRHTGRPVFGVIPNIDPLGLPEEDSVSFKAGLYDRAGEAAEGVEIAVIDCPHISNFTDVEPFLGEPDVRLRVVRRAEELGAPDAVILPGSKNVVHDLAALRERGFAEALLGLARSEKAEIVGLCGGFQMLGRRIEDPHGIESAGASVEALGLLDHDTVLEREKTLRRQDGVHLASGCAVRGYEIHHGESRGGGDPLFRLADGTLCGAASTGGRVWGTYLHGVFDADGFRRWFIDTLRSRRGLPPVGRVLAPYDLEPALDRLAGVVRAHLDMDRIHRLLGR